LDIFNWQRNNFRHSLLWRVLEGDVLMDIQKINKAAGDVLAGMSKDLTAV
jgi:hypothetical protein